MAALGACAPDQHDHDQHDHDHDHQPAHEHEPAHDHDHDHEAEAAADTHDEHGPDIIVLAPEKAEAAGIATEKVARADFNGVIRTSGRIMPASGDETTVASTVGGIIRLSRPISEGAEIGRGATIATISTASLPDGDISQRARIAYDQAKAEYDRASALLADKLVSQRDFEAIRAEYERARLAYESTGRGGNGRGIAVTAPSGGYVKQLFVKDGDYVETGQPIMTVTKNRHLYLRAEVAERDYAALRRVASAKFRTAYGSRDEVHDLARMGGRLVSMGKTPGAGSSFIPVTFEFDNTGDILPDSYAEIYLITAPRPGVISVPNGSLTEEQGVYFVYVKEDDDCYRKQEVTPGATDGERTEIVSGLSDGDEVVTAGAIHVRLAGAASTIPGHTHNH